MAKIDRPTKEAAANHIRERVRQIRGDFLVMQIGLQEGDFESIVMWPQHASRFAAEIAEFNSHGYTADVLGPLIVASIEDDNTKTWGTDYAPKYTAFKDAAATLRAYIIDHVESFTPSYNAAGRMTWKTSPGQEVVDQISTLINEALANVPGG